MRTQHWLLIRAASVVLALAAASGGATSARGEAPAAWAKAHADELLELYRHFHTHPELSFQEQETAARVAQELKAVGAEVTEKITSRLKASIWMVGAGLLALIAGLLVVEAAVFAIASFGLALHWACLVVAGVLAAGALAAFYYGRSVADDDLLPKRSARQISQDIRTTKEQLT